jgi:signal transduction histidine kinase
VSLKRQLVWVIGLLVMIPNIVIAVTSWFTSEREPQSVINLILWTLFLTIVAGWIGYFLSNVLLKPVDELSRSLYYLRGSERILSDLSLPSPKEPPPTEIAHLREGFDALLEHLRELLEAREATYAALTHDLKTPLLASMRALEYLEDADKIGPESRKDLLRQLQDEISRSYLLVENLLTASRLEAQRIQPETLNLRSVLEDFKFRYTHAAGRRGLVFEIEGSGHAKVERLLLERAVSNLTENALRYAKTKVVLRAGDGWIEMEDDGPGLPDSIEALSQPFRSQRLHGVRAGSAGLGLYVVRRVAEVHGGKLEHLKAKGTKLRLSLQ